MQKPSFTAYVSAINALKRQRALAKAQFTRTLGDLKAKENQARSDFRQEDAALLDEISAVDLAYRTALEEFNATQLPKDVLRQQARDERARRQRHTLQAEATRAAKAYDDYAWSCGASKDYPDDLPTTQKWDAGIAKKLGDAAKKANAALRKFDEKHGPFPSAVHDVEESNEDDLLYGEP